MNGGRGGGEEGDRGGEGRGEEREGLTSGAMVHISTLEAVGDNAETR